jgi:hypothetical protein
VEERDRLPINEWTVRAYNTLKRVLERKNASDFCGCYDGDLSECYPDACEEVLKEFIEEFTGMTVEQIKEIT